MAYKNGGKKVDCTDEGAEYNEKAIKAASRTSKKTESIETDYSIPGKKRGSYKQDGD